MKGSQTVVCISTERSVTWRANRRHGWNRVSTFKTHGIFFKALADNIVDLTFIRQYISGTRLSRLGCTAGHDIELCAENSTWKIYHYYM